MTLNRLRVAKIQYLFAILYPEPCVPEKMRRAITLMFILILLFGCEDNKPGKDLIPPEKLVPVLVDMHLVYALQSSATIRNIARDVDSVDTYGYIYDKYDITRVQFDSTIAWYSRHPKIFMDIYDQVIMELSRMSDSVKLDDE